MRLGTVVINERVFSIQSLRLANGGVEFVFEIPYGPMDWGNREYQMFGADGELCWTGRFPDLGEKTEQSSWTWTHNFQVVDKLTNDAEHYRREGI